MGHISEKTERNEKIRELYASGVSQTAIGKKYGIAQCRVSAIVHRRVPMYHYCNYCNKHAETGALCNKCRERRIKERAARKVAVQAEKMRRKAAYQQRLKQFALNREKRIQKRKEERLRAYQQQAKRQKARLAKIVKRPEPIPLRYGWQTKGREYVRFLVRFRDRFTCQDCGAVRTPEMVEKVNKKKPRSMKSFDVHHINGICGQKSRKYDSVKEMGGLITLCHRCHFNRHDFSKKGHYAVQVSGPERTSGKKKVGA